MRRPTAPSRRPRLPKAAWLIGGLGALIGIALFPVRVPAGLVRAQIAPQEDIVRAPGRLIVLQRLKPDAGPVARNEALLSVFNDERAVDLAVAINGLQETIDRILDATDGRETGEVRQFRQKVVYLRRMLSQARKSEPLYSPFDGSLRWEPDLFGSVKQKGDALATVLSTSQWQAVVDLPADDAAAFQAGDEAVLRSIDFDWPTMSRAEWPGGEAGGIETRDGDWELGLSEPPELPADPPESAKLSGTVLRIGWLNAIEADAPPQAAVMLGEAEITESHRLAWQEQRGDARRARLILEIDAGEHGDALARLIQQGGTATGTLDLGSRTAPLWQALTRPTPPLAATP